MSGQLVTFTPKSDNEKKIKLAFDLLSIQLDDMRAELIDYVDKSVAIPPIFRPGPGWFKYTLPFSAFAAASLSSTVLLAGLPPKGFTHAAYAKHSVKFIGGTVSGIQLTLGTADDPTVLLAPFDVFSDVADTNQGYNGVLKSQDYASASQLFATLTAEDGFLNALTQGVVEIQIMRSVLA